MDIKLSEFLGIHYGDGCLRCDSKKSDYCFTYSGDSRFDTKYMARIDQLFKELFGIYLKHEIFANCYTLRGRSKTIFNFLSIFLQCPIGPKKDLRLPLSILSKNSHLAAFLRGLFDTDGCVTLQKDKGYNYILIKYSMKSYVFAQDIHEGLKKFNISSYICRGNVHQVVIRKNSSVKNFFKYIEPKNERKLKKYKTLKKNMG